MAGSISVAKTDLGGAITKYAIAWSADGIGKVSGSTFEIKRGHLRQAKFVFNGGAPTPMISALILDPDGADLLVGAGSGAFLSSAPATYIAPLIGNAASVLPLFIEGFSHVEPIISGATAGGSGAIMLYVGP